jgi:hypothetical protein
MRNLAPAAAIFHIFGCFSFANISSLRGLAQLVNLRLQHGLQVLHVAPIDPSMVMP